MSHGATRDLDRLLRCALLRDEETEETERDIKRASEALTNVWLLLKDKNLDCKDCVCEWKRVVQSALSDDFSLLVKADCIDKRIAVDLVASWLIYFPLCRWIIEVCRQRMTEGCRTLVGVGGSAAAGKTTLCCVLRAFLNCMFVDCLECEVVGMDAFHLRNESLVRMGLRHLKGRPNTFDVESLTKAAIQLKSLHNSPVTLPVYDRNLHNPRSNGVTIDNHCPVVLIEGLFVLCNEAGFEAVWSQLDCKIFLQISHELCERRSVERKATGNRIIKEEALVHFHTVDEPNFYLIEESSKGTDVVLEIGECYEITSAKVTFM